MFGLGKLIGGALNAIGLGKLAPFVSMGIDFFTGDYLSLATDVMGLMSKMKGLGFLNSVAQFAPLGGFGSTGFDVGGCFGDGGFGRLFSERLDGLTRVFAGSIGTNYTPSAQRLRDMFDLLTDTAQNRELIQTARSSVALNSALNV